MDDLNKTKQYFNETPLSLYKVTDEITYKVNSFLKFSPNTVFIGNKAKRAKILTDLIPYEVVSTDNFIKYDWMQGNTLYQHDSLYLYLDFLNTFKTNISKSKIYQGSKEVFDEFYITKTNKRVAAFKQRFGSEYLTQRFTINSKQHEDLATILNSIEISQFYNNPMYDLFHGDLQFDNILYNLSFKKFIYIDWRDSFGDSTEGGDIYYDLAKLYGGSIIPYNLMKKEDSIIYEEGSTEVNYSYNVSTQLTDFRIAYEKWIVENNFDLNKVKLITAIIFLNMSPLHDDKFGKMLWFKSIELLSEHYK